MKFCKTFLENWICLFPFRYARKRNLNKSKPRIKGQGMTWHEKPNFNFDCMVMVPMTPNLVHTKFVTVYIHISSLVDFTKGQGHTWPEISTLDWIVQMSPNFTQIWFVTVSVQINSLVDLRLKVRVTLDLKFQLKTGLFKCHQI